MAKGRRLIRLYQCPPIELQGLTSVSFENEWTRTRGRMQVDSWVGSLIAGREPPWLLVGEARMKCTGTNEVPLTWPMVNSK